MWKALRNLYVKKPLNKEILDRWVILIPIDIFESYLRVMDFVMYVISLVFFLGCSSQNHSIETNQIQQQSVKDNKNATTKSNPVQNISVPELFQLYSSNQDDAPIIIDVRTIAEYEKVHIPTAIHIPLQELGNRVQDIEKSLQGKDKEIYLVCAVGGRSAQGAEILSKMGFSKPINVMGGTNGWVALGFPTEKGSKTSQSATP